MHLFRVESRSLSRIGKWIASPSFATLFVLILASVVLGRPFGKLGRNRDQDKENRPWTYASGALGAANPPLANIESAPALSDLRRVPAAGPASVGDPLAPAKMELLEREIRAGLQARGISGDFSRFGAYLAEQLRATSGPSTGSEVTGNCRLSWYDHLLRTPLTAPVETEQFTRELHRDVLSGPKGLARVLATIRRKLDLPNRPSADSPDVRSPKEALLAVAAAIVAAKAAQAAALAPLSGSEVQELSTSLYPVLTSQNTMGHTLNDRGTGRRMCDLLERMNRDAMFQAAEAFAPLINKGLLAQLAKIPEEGQVAVPGVSGSVLRKIDTAAGAIVIGGRGRNVYSFDQMPEVACVIDLGGDDEYHEGVAGVDHPVMVILDLAGNDAYRGSRPGIQGSAILGASLLVDVAGDDLYEGQDVCQGACIGGVGILVDFAGNDRYHGYRRTQAAALAGLGLLLDFAGNDDYRAAMWAQGLGHPLGFGLLDDVQGNDHYYCGGQWPDSYPETPGYEGWGQGIGSGIRQVASGGIGVLLDGAGDDVYEFDYIAHGGGYWCGVGLARDFAGNDQRFGSTGSAYNGGPRGEPEFQRFGCGFGCHYALGFCFDDAGDDFCRGTIMNQGFGWDCSVGVLCDFGGHDKYQTNGSGASVQGQGAQASLGILFDWDGNDEYVGSGQGYANSGTNYHAQPACGGNFSFVIDEGGEDKYGCGAVDNTYIQRGSAGGFLIDRPSRPQAKPENAKGAKDKAKDPPAAHKDSGR
jgi:hypothetical protein